MLWLSHYPFQAASVAPQYLPTPFLMGFITRQLYFVMNPITYRSSTYNLTNFGQSIQTPGFPKVTILSPISARTVIHHDITHSVAHRLQTAREEIAFTSQPKIHSQSHKHDGSLFCLPHRPKFSDIFDLCLHWVSVFRTIIDQI